MDVNVTVSPSLHPSNVSALQGYDEDTADAVADVLEAFSTAYESLTKVHAARKAAKENPTLTEAAQVLAVADYADKTLFKITAKVDAANRRVTAAIAEGERTLSQPLEGASIGGLTAEVRAHVKSLKQPERIAFMNEVIRLNDTKTLAAVLGAPPYLSGLLSDERQMYVHSYREQRHPLLARRLAVMKAAEKLLGERSGLIFEQMDMAVGAKPAQVANLRSARAKAEKAFV